GAGGLIARRPGKRPLDAYVWLEGSRTFGRPGSSATGSAAGRGDMRSRYKLFRKSDEASVSAPVASFGTFMGGLGLGSVLAYYLDPRLGRQRRARAHDKALHTTRAGGREVSAIEHDL